MVYRLTCGLLLVALAGCASGEDLSQSSGFGASFPATTPGSASATASATATATEGMSSTSEPTGGTDSSAGTSGTTDLVRPDLPVDPTMGDTDATTDPVGTTSGPAIVCGDGIIQPGEECEGADLNGQSCESLGFTGGTLACDANCLLDKTQCFTIVCGDGVIEGAEECEGADLNGQSCESLGFSGGTLTCDPNCLFDKSQCFSISCGDGVLNGDEECDCGQQGSQCTAEQLGGATCSQFAAPQNGNYHGGNLACGSPQSCTYNKSGCTYCGDGVRNGPEACEGGDLGGQTCQSLGYYGGTLSCNANCTHNTGGCFNVVCGDGVCNGGEDSCSCPQDCPDDPNSCSPCECGLYNANWLCQCDSACTIFGDCCWNAPC